MVDVPVSVSVELKDTADDEENYGDSSQPPSDSDTCSETRHNEKYRADNVTDDG